MRIRIKKAIVLWVALLVLATGVLLRFFVWQPVVVPQHFLEARERSVNTAHTIVRLTNDSLIDLQNIAGADRSGETQRALDLVRSAIEKNTAARQEALNLSAALEIMSKNLPDISPWRARDRATEALGYDVTMINHLLTYNQFLQQLLELLEQKFRDPGRNYETQIKNFISRINEEGEAISTLNRKFNDAMRAFDQLTNR